MDTTGLFNLNLSKKNYHKIFNKEKYYIDAFNSFKVAKNNYVQKQNNEKVIECFEQMLLCLKEYNNVIILTQTLDDYGSYLIEKNQNIYSQKGLKFLNLASVQYLQSGNYTKLIQLKQKLILYYSSIKNHLSVISLYKDILELCTESKIYQYCYFCEKLVSYLIDLKRVSDALEIYTKLLEKLKNHSTFNKYAVIKIVFITLLCILVCGDSNGYHVYYNKYVYYFSFFQNTYYDRTISKIKDDYLKENFISSILFEDLINKLIYMLNESTKRN